MTIEKDKPLISVIVPAYNVEMSIKSTIQDLLNQSYNNIEVLCINDGSVDSTNKIIDAIEDKRFFVFNKSNGGVSSARNLGLDNARGKYITFVDPGDEVDRDFISYLYKLIIRNDAQMSVCSYDFLSQNGDKINRRKFYDVVNRITFFSKEEAISELIKHYSKICGHVWDKMFERSLVGELRFDERIHNCEDTLFVYQYIKKCERIVLGPEIHYGYTQDDTSVTNGAYSEKYFTSFLAWEQILSDLKSKQDIINLKKKLTKDVIFHANKARKTLNRSERQGYKNRFLKLLDKYKSFDSIISLAEWVYLDLFWAHV